MKDEFNQILLVKSNSSRIETCELDFPQNNDLFNIIRTANSENSLTVFEFVEFFTLINTLGTHGINSMPNVHSI